MIDNKKGHWTICLSAVQLLCAAATITGRTHGAAQTTAAAGGTRQTGPIRVFIIGISNGQLTFDCSVALR